MPKGAFLRTAELGARAGRLQTRTGELAAALPGWAWVALVFLASVGLRFALSLRVHAPWVFQDEIVYSDLGRSLGETGHFAIRQLPGTSGFGILYPAFLSTAYAAFSAPAKAYLAAKLINAILMSSAAFPTYLIARRLMRTSLAVAASFFAVAIPSLAMTMTLMTENAFYPASMAAAAALFLLLERPTLLRQLAFFAFALLAFEARAQGVILVGALLAGIALLAFANAWRGSRFETREVGAQLWRFRVSLGIVLLGSVAIYVYERANGRSLTAALGAYRGVTAMHHPFLPTLRWLVMHVGELDLYLGVIPFVALIIVTVLGLRPAEASPALRAFAASALALVAFFVLTAAAYAADLQGQRIEERYMFHVAPLFFVALFLWIDRGLPRPPLLTGIAAALAAALPGAVAYPQLVTSDVVHDAFALTPLLSLELKGTLNASNIAVAVTLAAIVGAALAVAVPARVALLLPLVVAVYYGVIELRPIDRRIVAASQDALRAGITVRRDWIDRRVGPGAQVALVVYGGTTALPYWQNEFFNRSVRTVYTMAGPYDGVTRTDVAPDSSGRLHDAAGRLIRSRYVLSNYQVTPAGRRLAEDRGVGMSLLETSGPVRVLETVVGLYPDRWSGGGILYTQYGCDGGVLRAHLLSDPDLFQHGTQKISALIGTRTIAQIVVRAGRPAMFKVPLPRAGGVCTVTFSVTPTAVPAQVIHTGDTRQLGIRFLGFDYRRGSGRAP